MTETTEQLSLGQQLKQAREAQHFSIDDVAQKTNLKKNHIDALENDIFILPNVPPAFVRGYVRNYVRFLRLPETLVALGNYGEVTIPKEVKKAAPLKVSNNQKSQSRWVKVMTWLILLAAVGMTLAWWWQEHQKDEMSRESLVTTAAVEQAESTPQAVEIRENSANQVQAMPEPAPVLETAAPSAEVANAASNSEPAAEAVVSSEQPVVENPASANVLVQTAQSEQPTAEQPATEQPQAVGNDELRIEITGGQSWITVRNTKAKRSLAEKLYNDGEVLTFNNNEAYRLTIGAPANVKIYYKGQQVPLKVDGRVARIKLPQ